LLEYRQHKSYMPEICIYWEARKLVFSWPVIRLITTAYSLQVK
jgi:hypothetical protein